MIKFFATGLYAGYCPVAPGTVGSLVGVVLSLLFPQNLYFQATIIGTSLIVGIPICSKVEKQFHRKDPSQVVWDEVVGIWIALFLLPRSYKWIIAAFILFRCFDIWKKPFKSIERLPGGYGIMLDDVAAGLSANLVLQSIRLFF